MLLSILSTLSSSNEESFTIVPHWNALPSGKAKTVKDLKDCEERCVAPSCLQFTFNLKSNHCFTSSSATWGGEALDHTTSGCLAGAVKGCPGAPTPTPPTPTPPAPTPPTPTPPTPAVSLKHVAVVTPFKHPPTCAGSPQGGMLGAKMYFLPVAGASTNITVYDSSNAQPWSLIPLSAASGVAAMLSDGVSMAAVESAPSDPSGEEFLVVSGGGTSRVVSYSTRTMMWSERQGLEHKISNSCSIGCDGLWYTMTGDFKKETAKAEPKVVVAGGDLKPSDRQIYCYNMSTGGFVFVNNGEKTRGGAGCACGPALDGVPSAESKVFFAGGYSDSGATDQMEVWKYPLARRGEPKLSLQYGEARDIGGGSCGGLAVFAGGDNKGEQLAAVGATRTDFNVSDPATMKGASWKLSVPLAYARIGCVSKRYALISGGMSGKTCNRAVWLLDTLNPPPPGSVLPTIATLNATGAVAVATSMGGDQVGFFDGTTLDLFSLPGKMDESPHTRVGRPFGGCVNDASCSLNGACLHNGSCACDAPWHGETCGLLQFKPTPPGGAYGFGEQFAVTSWGGNAIEHNGTWHGFFTEIGGTRCGLDRWTNQSTVVHAIASTAGGPYVKVKTVLKHQAHNPQTIYVNDAWYIFHIGSANSAASLHNCDEEEEITSTVLFTAPSPGSHIHRSIDGPGGPYIPVIVDSYPSCNNPGPFLHPNGTLFLICTWSLHAAPRPEGPWRKVVDFKVPTTNTRHWEDPYLFINTRGFHILAHTYSMAPFPSIATSGYAFSVDGLAWTFSELEPYPSTVLRVNGTIQNFATMERPKFLFADPTAPDRPTHIINGVSPFWNASDPSNPCATCGHCSACKCKGGIDWTYTLARPLVA